MPSAIQTRHGISMAETVISTLLIGFVLVSTLQLVGPMARSTSVHADRLVAANLANEITEEIGTLAWTSPILDDLDSIGPGGGEVRQTYDDVDDFDNWSSSPPKFSTGQSNVYLNGWTRAVIVDHVLLSDAETISGTFTGLKRVTVIVSKNGTELARVDSLHSYGADQLSFIVP